MVYAVKIVGGKGVGTLGWSKFSIDGWSTRAGQKSGANGFDHPSDHPSEWSNPGGGGQNRCLQRYPHSHRGLRAQSPTK